MGGDLPGALAQVTELLGQRGQVSKKLHLHPVPLHLADGLQEILFQQPHDGSHLLRRTLPVFGGKGVYRQATADEAKATDFTSAKIVSDADGKVLVKGLDAGTYYLRETKAPEGYNKLLSDIKIEIKATYGEDGKLASYKVDYTYNGTPITGTAIQNKDNSPEVAVENKTGAQLPSTGSKGALMVTLAGIVLFGALTASKAFGKKKANN